MKCLPASTNFRPMPNLPSIFYNLQARMLSDPQGQKGLMAATAPNKARVQTQLATIAPDGGTDHMLALREALKLKPEVIFFLTDADLMTNSDVNEILAEVGIDADPGRRVRARNRAGPANPVGPVGNHHRRLISLHRREPVPPVEWRFLKTRSERGLSCGSVRRTF